MNKPYVICHMYTSIDGRIDGNYMDEVGCDISGKYYDDKIFKLGNSMASGRITSSLYKAKGKANLNDYRAENSNDDFIIKNDYYNFVFDRFGKCFYDDSFYEYGGKKMQIVEVVSTKCDKRYLAYLKDKDISYIIADSLKDSLKKIYEKFNVEVLVLTGGAIINGGFLKEDLIDEVSLIVAPYIEGNNEYKTAFSTDYFINKKYIFMRANPLLDGGVELIFKRENSEREEKYVK